MPLDEIGFDHGGNTSNKQKHQHKHQHKAEKLEFTSSHSTTEDVGAEE